MSYFLSCIGLNTVFLVLNTKHPLEPVKKLSIYMYCLKQEGILEGRNTPKSLGGNDA